MPILQSFSGSPQAFWSIDHGGMGLPATARTPPNVLKLQTFFLKRAFSAGEYPTFIVEFYPFPCYPL